ncbi:SDR family oxidoreductase [Synechococcus sp. M16CYN]|uniref:SDR family oxidoreductase n=1 Tax=Synechococcus sp. M16CYN TaxID=3103139 RepID=UPI003253AD2F
MTRLKQSSFKDRCIGITGARGTLGRAFARSFRAGGAEVVGFTHGTPPSEDDKMGPNYWISWSCGNEAALDHDFARLDVLVVNHGINPHGAQSIEDVNKTLEVNALSSWRLMQRFDQISQSLPKDRPREIWINTSEAEIQPAISPVYELSKRLLGQLVSLRGATLDAISRDRLIIRKLVLGPFRSDLNPIGLMEADFVASQVLWQASRGMRLIIVTPNPVTYILMPLTELGRRLYSQILNHSGR